MTPGARPPGRRCPSPPPSVRRRRCASEPRPADELELHGAGCRSDLLLFVPDSFAAAPSAFSGTDDLRNRTDGALWEGPPNDNTLWGEFVRNRDPETPEILPVYQRGVTVRFGAAPSDLDRPATTWTSPRVAYLQHPSDPIVWWSTRLMLHKPDWLKERRGRDVLPSMRWYPFVTFWQVGADMAFSRDAPPGHGHNYGSEPVGAWAVIAPPEGWTSEKTARLTAVLAEAEGTGNA